jgi:hypothetical protein
MIRPPMAAWMLKVEGKYEKESFYNYTFSLNKLFTDDLRGFKIYSRRFSVFRRL